MPRPHRTTYSITLQWEHGGMTYDVELEVYADVMPGSPGRLSGPPESCCPPEAAEVTYMRFDVEELPDALQDYLYEHLTEQAAADEEFARESAAESAADARRER